MKTSLIPLFLLTAAAAFAAADPARFAAAKALYDERKFPEAEAAFRKLAAADAANAEVHHYLGIATFRRGDPEAATKILERAVELAPGNAAYFHDLGDVYGQAAQKAGMLSKFGLAKKCLAAYQRAAELEPANANHHQALFEYYRQAPGIAGGSADKAEAEAATILQLDPARGHTVYATLHTANKEYDKAVPHLAELKKLDPVRGRLGFAALFVEKKEFDKAFAEFEEVLKTTPDDYGALYQVGRIAALSGQRVDRGLATLRRCLDLTPG
jgi:tetratricopeptide (TPR) repeat protein